MLYVGSMPHERQSRRQLIMLVFLAWVTLAACSAPLPDMAAPASVMPTPVSTAMPQPRAARNVKQAEPRKRPLPAVRATGPQYQVTYSLSGDVRDANIIYVSYAGEQGLSRQDQVALPWKTSFVARKGEYLYLSAQGARGIGVVNCEILVNGKSTGRSSSKGGSRVASCDHVVSTP